MVVAEVIVPENPWKELGDPSYELQNIGRPAVFLVPSGAFSREIRMNLEKFLLESFGGFQRSDSLVSGVYTTDAGRVALDKCIQYEVSFLGKERIPELARVLANLARMTDEECIYLKAGQYSALLRPENVT